MVRLQLHNSISKWALIVASTFWVFPGVAFSDKDSDKESCFPRTSSLSLASFKSMDPSTVKTTGTVHTYWRKIAGKKKQVLSLGPDADISVVADTWQGGRFEAIASVAKSSENETQLHISLVKEGKDHIELWHQSVKKDQPTNVGVTLPSFIPGGSRLKIATMTDTRDDGTSSSKRDRLELISPSLTRRASECLSPMGPNIILITSDTTRADELEPYGGSVGTIAISKLAREGVIFERAYSVGFGTTPSHASIMTSKHPKKHLVYDNQTVLDQAHLTLPEVLRAAGYLTAAFVSARPLARGLGVSQGFDVYEDTFITDAESGLGSYSRHEKRANLTIDQAIEWLNSNSTKKFFLWIHLFDAHQPYAPPSKAYTSRYLSNNNPDLVQKHEAQLKAQKEKKGPTYLKAAKLKSLPESELLIEGELAIANYRGEISFLDEELNRLLTYLKTQSLLDDSAIVLTADHGENFLEQGRPYAFNHDGLNEPVIRVPLIIRYPKTFDSGSVRTDLAASIDIAPTVLSLAGIEPPPDFTGRDLSTPTGRKSLLIEGAARRWVALRADDWSYIEQRRKGDSADGELILFDQELFDLGNDPKQTEDLSQKDSERLDAMRAVVSDALSADQASTSKPKSLITPEHLDALRALGYLE